ncbi:MAG: sporulation transcriptional regulator SpoIIID [Clostridia bacterium]|nr:sporulation transcriptional regulator SpoIIID [Clostridia bacterium]
MQDYIEERVLQTAGYIIDKRATVRQAATRFSVCKSTVHKDVTQRLERIRPDLAAQVYEILQINKAERHLRGGAATHRKYRGMDA